MNNTAPITKLAAKSRSTAVAGAIAGMVREGRQPVLQAIGAPAVNQAVKAVAIARGYLEVEGIEIVCAPSFADVLIERFESTAIRLNISCQQPATDTEPQPLPSTPAHTAHSAGPSPDDHL